MKAPVRPRGAEVLLWGRHAVLASLRAGARRLDEVWLAERANLREIEASAAARGVAVRRVPPARLDRAAEGGVHQGVLLRAGPLPRRTLSEILAVSAADAVVLAIDHPQDPHHLGAAVRSAEAFGAAGLIIPREGSAPLAGVACKAAAGAAETLPIALVGDLVESIRTARAAGWRVLAAAADGDAVPAARTDLTGRILFVVGGEGRGVSPRARAACDAAIRIPLVGRTESLSLSAAAAILLYEFARRTENPAE